MPVIPVKIALALLIVVPITIWFVGTSKYDFMTPRSLPSHELRPEFPSPLDREIAESLNSRIQEPPEKIALPKIEIGDLQTSPSLATYLEDAQLGAPALLDLAARLQKIGQVQRAVLAYERILDSTPANTKPRLEAESSLANLKATLPPWNADSSAATTFTINFNTAREPESLEGAINTLSELVRVSSGNQALPRFLINKSPKPSEELPALPIAMWLTITGEDVEKPSLTVLSVVPQSENELSDKLTAGLFYLLNKRIQSIGALMLPNPLEAEQEPENAVVNRITRLSWKQILSTPFQSLEEGPPAETNNSTEATSEEEENPPE